MENELKLAIWKIANAAIEMHENKLNGKEFEELAMNTLRQVKKLNTPVVIKSVCEYGMNLDNCIRKADTCFECLKDN